MARKDADKGKRERRAERRVNAFDLRKQGLPYREIAKRLGCSTRTVYTDVERTLDELNRRAVESLDHLRRLELERLDEATAAIYPKVKRGDVAAIDRMLKLQERRAKLLGLDVPVRQDSLNVHVKAQVQQIGHTAPARSVLARMTKMNAVQLNRLILKQLPKHEEYNPDGYEGYLDGSPEAVDRDLADVEAMKGPTEAPGLVSSEEE